MALSSPMRGLGIFIDGAVFALFKEPFPILSSAGEEDGDPFVNVHYEGENLIANNFSGFIYKVNLQDGKVELIDWEK